MAKKFVTSFAEKKVLMECCEMLEDYIQKQLKELGQEWRVVGKEQGRSWKDDELKWEDEEKTIPHMVDKYDYVPLTDKELADDDHVDARRHIDAWNSLLVYLDKLA